MVWQNTDLVKWNPFLRISSGAMRRFLPGSLRHWRKKTGLEAYDYLYGTEKAL